MGTNGLDAYPFIHFNAFDAAGAIIQTLSFDYFPTIQTSLIPYSYNGAYNWYWSNGETSGTKLNNSTCDSIPVKLYQWNHITVTAGKYDTTSTTRGIGYIKIGSAKHTSNTINYWLFANVQVEAKDHETGFTPFNTFRSAEKIGDASGYKHIATPSAITISTDTPRYSHSAVFNSSNNSYIKIEDTTWMADRMPAITINLWAKVASAWPTAARLFSCTEGGGFNCEAGNSGYWRFPVHVYTSATEASVAYKFDSNEIKLSDLPVGEWVMLTWVYDNFGTRTYINGELHHTYLNSSYGIHFNAGARLFLGCEANAANPSSPYFNG
jgi:hypothetical protein